MGGYLRTEGMESGHRIFLVGVALLLLGLLVTIPAIFGLNLGLAYAGLGLSLIGFILFVLGIHIFMRETTVEVRDILGLPRRNQSPAGNPIPSEDTPSRRLGIRETILVIIVFVFLPLAILAFLFIFAG